MAILIDTHVWLGLEVEPERLTSNVLAQLRDRGTTVLFSSASAAEAAIKMAVGKLSLKDPLASVIPASVNTLDLTVLPFDLNHAARLADLPLHHRDPFDRMLIAQAMCEGAPIVTADPWFDRYDVDVIHAA